MTILCPSCRSYINITWDGIEHEEAITSAGFKSVLLGWCENEHRVIIISVI